MKLTTLSYDSKNGWSAPIPEYEGPRTVAFIFGATSFLRHNAPIQELQRKLPQALFFGCSSAGEIFGGKVYDESLTVAITQFESTDVKSAAIQIEKAEQSFSAGLYLAQQLQAPNLQGIMLFSDGICVNGTELVKGINSIVSNGAIVTGGLAGDGDRFKETWVLRDGVPQSKQITALGLYGDKIRISHGSKGGWDIFGPERVVTKSTGNVLYELDKQPALELYKKYLGELASGLPASALLFPLALMPDATREKRSIVRTILAVNEAENSLTFAGDIPLGCKVQLMRANFDRLIDGASNAASMTALNSSPNDGPTLAIAISCVGRRLVLGLRTEEEVEATLDILPKGTQQIGFYSYGEISPYIHGAPCDLHNQTMTLTTLQESA